MNFKKDLTLRENLLLNYIIKNDNGNGVELSYNDIGDIVMATQRAGHLIQKGLIEKGYIFKRVMSGKKNVYFLNTKDKR